MKRFLSILLVLALAVTFLPVTAQAAKGGKLVAMTFDDGPSNRTTGKLLDGLKARGVKVTFFMQGQYAQSYPDILKRAYEDGHEIASHTWNHPDLTGCSAAEVESQISRTEAVFDSVCGAGNRYLVRPPYGSTNETVRSLIHEPLIYWSVDTRDWENFNAYTVRDNILSMTFDGSIVLLHDIHSTSVEGALMAIDRLLDMGYEFVTVSELYRRRGVEMTDGVLHYSCKPNGTDLGPISKPVITYTTDRTNMEVTITSDPGTTIHYTTDGSVPNGSSPVYTGPVTLPFGTSIRAVAGYNMNGSRSDMAELIWGGTPCKAPKLEAKDGLVTMTSPASSAPIHYTTDGTKATAGSTLYTGPVALPGGHYIHAVSGGDYYQLSAETVLYYSQRGNLYADMAPGSWYFESIDRIVSAGLMAGMGDHIFEPNTKLTRGMLVSLLYRYSGEDLGDDWTKTYTFTDVDRSAWYAESVEWAYRNGIVSGYSASSFKPNGNINRQELCKVIDGFLDYRGNPLTAGESCREQFTDYDRIEAWARDSVDAMVAAGLLYGDDGKMNPMGSATRAEVAAILCRVMDYEAAAQQPEEPPVEEPEPTEPPVEETEPITEPTEPPVEETEPVTEPTEPPVEETDPPTEPTQEPTEPPTEETQIPA